MHLQSAFDNDESDMVTESIWARRSTYRLLSSMLRFSINLHQEVVSSNLQWRHCDQSN